MHYTLSFLLVFCLLGCSGSSPAERRTQDEVGETTQSTPDQSTDSAASETPNSATELPDSARSESAPIEPAPPRKNRMTIAVISDLNSSYGSTTYREEVHQGIAWLAHELKPDLVLCTGDMVAGQRRGLDYEAMWEAFHSAVSQPLREADIPLAITPGNHDASAAPKFVEEREEFRRQWAEKRPRVTWVSDESWPELYAFTFGHVFFASLDATLTGPLKPEAHTWVSKTIKDHTGPKFVFGHLPLYPIARGREHEILADRALEARLVDNDVTMYISGHHHAYYPGRRGDLRLLSAPILGDGPRPVIGTETPSDRGILVIDIHEGTVDYRVHVAPDFRRVLDESTLPDVLNASAPALRVERDKRDVLKGRAGLTLNTR